MDILALPPTAVTKPRVHKDQQPACHFLQERHTREMRYVFGFFWGSVLRGERRMSSPDIARPSSCLSDGHIPDNRVGSKQSLRADPPTNKVARSEQTEHDARPLS
ncbi:hypothetical protein [Bradyrhizobium elkanii]|uniref:hypothetical protein n=1 Tax=Bradyrhizobium elkanii TaxID=29448 RepID=UPI0012FD0C64|nr:hypothetical protein [Bradyrhizobium elkanii]